MRFPVLKTLILAGALFINSPFVGFSQNDPLIVTHAVDGDTLQLSNGEKVRLIGIDTPESSNNAKMRRDAKRTGQDAIEIVRMGKEAAAFTRNLVQDKKVRLELDVRPRDKYGRLLAYVYLEDGTFVNAEIMKAGYAQVMTYPPNVKYQDLFLGLQKEAREKGLGLWSDKAMLLAKEKK
ncbi:MAG TPA: thermonuclease family protein [Candidatus Omnitrophota bacterium]|nr:thermonuclease family protein [Candidatus Omnitrophota bacterium]